MGMGKKRWKTTWCNSLSHWILLHDKLRRDKAGNLVGVFVQHVGHLQRIAGKSYPLMSSMEERKECRFICLALSRLLFPLVRIHLIGTYFTPTRSSALFIWPLGDHSGYSVVFRNVKVEGDPESIKWQRDAGLSWARLGPHGQPRISLIRAND